MAERVRRPTPMVRRAEPADADAWLAMRGALWPDAPEDHQQEIAKYFGAPPGSFVCLVASLPSSGAVGFAEVGLRPYAEECRTSPVGYLEGIYVMETHRRQGVAGALVVAAEAWARDRGCSEMASDRELHNEESGLFHTALGFEETVRIVCFRKTL